MTLSAPPAPPPVVDDEPTAAAAVTPLQQLRGALDISALLLAVAVLMGPVAVGGGGRDAHRLLLALVAVVPAVLLGRVWRLGARALVLALAPGIGAAVVCATAPTGWAGAGDVARFLYVGLLWLCVRAIADTPERRALVLIAVSVGGLYQFDQAYLSWWGRGDVAHAMSGSFYAPNVFAAYMAGSGLAAVVLAATGPGRTRLVGFVAAPLCLAAVAYSSSRATIGLAALAVVVGLCILVVRRAWRDVARWVAVVVLAAAVTTLLGSSLLMEHSGGALSGAQSKSDASSQTLASSGGVRVEWWKAAARVGAEHPLSGAGFGSFGGAESRYQPADHERTSYVHNVLLQAWSDGGTALALPMLLALVAAAIALLRRLRVREPAALAALLGGGVMVVHAMLDIDAQYPSAVGLAVVLLALGSSVPVSVPETAAVRRRSALVPAVLLITTVALLASVRADAANARVLKAQLTGGAWTGVDGPLRDARFDVVRLDKGKHDDALLRRTERLQQDSASVTWSRATALVAAGRPGEARRLAEATWAARSTNQPGQVTGYAQVLIALGERDTAVRLLVQGIRDASRRPESGDEPLRLLTELAKAGRPDVARCLFPELPQRLRDGATVPATSGCAGLLASVDDGEGA